MLAMKGTLNYLRFKVLDPNDSSAIRFEVPRRFSSLRGKSNQRLEACELRISAFGGGPMKKLTIGLIGFLIGFGQLTLIPKHGHRQAYRVIKNL